MSNFYVGQKVVCIDDTQMPGGYEDEFLPSNGCIYVIREILIHPDPGFELVCIRLLEIVNKSRPYKCFDGVDRNYEPCFRTSRFRPVKTTDISIFTAMLAPTPRVKQPV